MDTSKPISREIPDALYNDRLRIFTEYLDSPVGSETQRSYLEDMIKMLNSEKQRLVVNLDDIRDFNREYADGILNEPMHYLPAFDQALRDVVLKHRDPRRHSYLNDKRLYVAIKGSFGEYHVSPRTLRAAHIGKLVCVEGIVTRCSLIHPKMVRSVHWCEATKIHYYRDYFDSTSDGGNGIVTGAAYPKEDPNGNPLSIEFGYSTFRDHQVISIQEMPERAPPGQLPRNVEIFLDDDMIDSCKPGDRVQLVGQYRSLGNRNQNSASSIFKTVILANHIVILSTKSGGIAQEEITDTDIRNINKVSKGRHIFDLLSSSLAPSIYGHDYIKKAILLMLLGGCEKNLEDGTHIRGDINILMVGDPSTAKSQMLRFVLNAAPLAIATTGRGSSGVGLTAAVLTDKETGDRRLEAGAMVLADRGVVCIDEFDKMSDIDRVAIHEVMEQQTITIAKGGIHTSLNARCSVVAAANPIYGQYDPHKDPHRNIALPDSLLSRFDLLFVVTDEIDDTRDRLLSEHVLRMHRYRQPGVEEGAPIREGLGQQLGIGDQDSDIEATPIYEKYDPLLHQGIRTRKKEILSNKFVKKYIQYSKNRIKPILTNEASEYIVEVFQSLRNDELGAMQRRTSPITARTLETLIRLATAHAKSRLSHRVEELDAKKAEEILRFALFKEVIEDPAKKKRRTDLEGDEEEEDEIYQEDDNAAAVPSSSAPTVSQSSQRTLRSTRSQTRSTVMTEITRESQQHPSARSRSSQVDSRIGSSQAVPTSQISWASERDENSFDATGNTVLTSQVTTKKGSESLTVSSTRVSLFTKKLGHLLRTSIFEDDQAKLEAILPAVNQDLSQEEMFSLREAKEALKAMMEKNQIMLDGDTIYRI